MFGLQIPKLTVTISNQLVHRNASQNASKNTSNLKIAICGAAGKIGQVISLMLKKCPLINELALYDTKAMGGMATELGHIDTNCHIKSYNSQIKEALENAQIVLICAAASPRTHCASVANTFKQNAGVVCDILCHVAQYCPKAIITISTNPVNCMIPLASEVLRRYRCYNANHLFGVTSLDVMRANTFVAEAQGLNPVSVNVPVIGGNTKDTIVPVLSQTSPGCEFKTDEIIQISDLIKNATEGIIKDKKGCCPPYLSCALAISNFITALVRAMKGEERIIQCAYVRSDCYPSVKYLVTPIELGIDGIQKNLGIPKLSEYEQCLLYNATTKLADHIAIAEEYAGVNNSGKNKRKIQCNKPKECIN